MFWKPHSSNSTSTENDHGATAQDNGSSNYKEWMYSDKTNVDSPVAVSRDGVAAASSSSIQLHRLQLPIAKYRLQILHVVHAYPVSCVFGETGSGKSTQIPQYLMEAGWTGCQPIPTTITVAADGNRNSSSSSSQTTTRFYSVLCIQPRSISPIPLARRVAIECNDSTSNSTSSSALPVSVVGYATRLEGEAELRSQQHIHYVTDDYFLHKTIPQDPLLSKYSVVIVDDAHLRTVLTDTTLATLKALQKNKRTNLRIVICSATSTDARSIIDYFYLSPDKSTTSSHCTSSDTIVSLYSWRESHPVEEFFVAHPITDYVQLAVSTAIQIHFEESLLQSTTSGTSSNLAYSASRSAAGAGDILCFLPTVEDIDLAIQMGEEMYQQALQLQQQEQRQQHQLKKKEKKRRHVTMQLVFLPLHSQSPSQAQARILQPHSADGKVVDFYHRRVILATDIAETTVSVPNVTHVIDSGKVQLSFFDINVQQQRQVVRPISKASAQQRKRCAATLVPIGPTAAQVKCGKIYRLYTQKDYFTLLPKTTQPEIERSNLCSFVLTVKSFGIDNMLQFDWITRPSVSSLMYALSTLYGLGAISSSLSDDDDHHHMGVPITTLGKQLNECPLDPFNAKVLLSSITLDCVDEIVTVISLAQVPNSRGILRRPRSSLTNTRQQQADYNAILDDIVDYSGDHMTYVNAMALADGKNEGECDESFLNYSTVARARVIRRQLHQFLRYISNKYYNNKGLKWSRQGDDADDKNNNNDLSERVRKCIVSGFFFNVARLKGDGQYYSVRYGNRIRLSSSSILSQYPYNYYSGGGRRDINKEYIVFSETYENGSDGDDVEARSCSIIDTRWLKELTPIYWM